MSSYKSVTRITTVGAALADAFAELQCLGEELDEACSNMDGTGLASTAKYETMRETADTLMNITEICAEGDAGDIPCEYAEQVPTRKGRGASRSVRCGNAVAMLSAAKDALAQYAEDHDGLPAEDAANAAVELDEPIGDAEGCEFPGMYG